MNAALTVDTAGRKISVPLKGSLMKRSFRPRKTANLSDSVLHQLNLYTLAASAAGVGVLALGQSAEAKIVYTKTHVVIGTNHIYDLDLNHDGIADFKIDNHSFFTDTIVASLSALPAQADNAVVGKQTHIGYPYSAYALRPGATVGPKQPFFGAFMAWSIGVDRAGRWVNVRGRYLGLKFRIKGKIHYGWARLNVTVGGSKITATLTGYAYETIPNKPIIAGSTKGPDQWDAEGIDTGASLTNPIRDTAQSASLGTLALGALGVPLWRRKELLGSEN
jgi:hypothetical protein